MVLPNSSCLGGLLVIASLLPAVAQTDTVFANASGCARLAGDVGSDDVLIWTGDAFEFWESTCPITQITQVGGGAVLATLTCSGEGETWDTYYMIETTSDVDRFVVYPDDHPNLRTEIATCQ